MNSKFIKILFSLVFFLVTFKSFAQSEKLYGEWKVLSVDNGEVYMSTETDSLYLNDDLKAIHNDSAKLAY